MAAVVGQDACVSRVIEPPNSVLLLVGREQFTPPATLDGQTAVATHDCVAVAVLSVDDGPTTVTVAFQLETAGLIQLGKFVIETEGHLSVRDIYNREYEAIGLEPGSCLVTVWGSDNTEPDSVIFHVRRPGTETY
jgi:hypothetical protein